jgi:uncharacterized protein (DUF3820 family)
MTRKWTRKDACQLRRNAERTIAELGIGLMPFGRHKGRSITALPPTYLTWLAANVVLEPSLAALVENAIKRRIARIAKLPVD